MKKHEQKDMADKLKSVIIDFDKAEMWDAIDSKMLAEEKKKKKRPIFWIFFGLALLTFSGALYFLQDAVNSDEKLVGNKTISDEIVVSNSVPKEKEEALVSERHLEVANQDVNSPDGEIPSLDKEVEKESKKVNQESKIPLRSSVSKNFYNSKPTIQLDHDLKSNSPVAYEDYSKSVALDNFKKMSLVNNISSSVLDERESISSDLLEVIIAAAVIQQDHDFALDFPKSPLSVSPEEESKRSKFSIVMGTYLLGGTKNFSSLTEENMAYSDGLNSSTKFLSMYGAQVQFLIPLKSGFSLSVGLEVSQELTKFNYIETYTESQKTYQDSAYFYLFENGLLAYYGADVEEEAEYKRTVQHYNMSTRVFALTGLRYSKQFSNWGLLVESTFKYAPYSIDKGKSLNQDLSITQLDDIVDMSGRNFVSARLGMGFTYRLSDRWMMEAMATGESTAALSSTIIGQNLQLWGGQINLRYRL